MKGREFEREGLFFTPEADRVVPCLPPPPGKAAGLVMGQKHELQFRFEQDQMVFEGLLRDCVVCQDTPTDFGMNAITKEGYEITFIAKVTDENRAAIEEFKNVLKQER